MGMRWSRVQVGQERRRHHHPEASVSQWRIQSHSRISMLGGLRVTLFDDNEQPVVSLWTESTRHFARTFDEATRLKNATPEPIDAILQAIQWHGKAATA